MASSAAAALALSSSACRCVWWRCGSWGDPVVNEQMHPAAGGVYVPSREFAHAGHELTQKVLAGKLSREHDPMFARLLAAAASEHFPGFRPDLVVSVPPKPGQDDRFRNVRRELAARLGPKDGGSALVLRRVALDYRRMSAMQRLATAEGSHVAGDAVLCKSLLLIDDVLTTGAQAAPTSHSLRAASRADG